MKAIKSLLAVSILAAAGVASAASVTTTNLNGTSSAVEAGGAFGTYAYIGAATGGDTTTNEYTGQVHFSTTLSPGPDGAQADITYKFTLNTAANTATSVITGCSNDKLFQCLSNYKVGTTASYTLDSFSFDGSNVSWQVHNVLPSPQLGGANVTTTFNYAGTAVPVPAAAWLFGSGLLGLAGTARRRRAA